MARIAIGIVAPIVRDGSQPSVSRIYRESDNASESTDFFLNSCANTFARIIKERRQKNEKRNG